MKIEELILTGEEMNAAIEQFLKWHNMNVKVVSLSPRGYPSTYWKITLDCDTDPNAIKPAPDQKV
jgi:hypothetical protein